MTTAPRPLHPRPLAAAVPLAAVMVLLGPAAGAAPTLTGHVDVDFTGPGVVWVDDANPKDVPLPDIAPLGFVSGWDIERVAWFHDPGTDLLYIGIQTYGIAGDADGNGDPSGEGAALNAIGGVDRPNLGVGESLAIAIDVDGDAAYDLVVGVPSAGDISDAGAHVFDGSPAAPGDAFGAAWPGLDVTIYSNPSAAQPHLELTVSDWSTATTGAGAFSALVFFGSSVDGEYGEDFVKDSTWPVEICFDADQDSVTTCQGDCDDRLPLCVSDCSDTNGDGLAECVAGTCTGDVDDDGLVDCSDPCLDADGDNYGVGPGCTDADCDDAHQLCSTDCVTDVDGDGLTNCLDGCWDSDGDGYGFGAGCLTDDCLDSTPLCTTDCSDLDLDDTPDCAQDCIDVDGDGYGEGDGCFGPDCDESTPLCHTYCDDHDFDGAPDCLDPDDDNDGLPDEQEDDETGTDRFDPDSDDDGLDDAEELQVQGTDPLDADTDDDGLSDGTEVMGEGPLSGFDATDPLDPDTDGDGLPDGLEVSVALPVPGGVSDGFAIPVAGTDGDAGWYIADADPETSTDPLDPDTDGDGLSDGQEDVDSDGATVNSIGDTGTEGSGESDPLIADTDGDGLVDGDEPTLWSTSPVDVDTDDDGLWDGVEANDLGTDPTDPDTDGGSVPDGLEVDHDLDPLDPTDDVETEYLGGSAGAGCSGTETARWGLLLLLLAFALLRVGPLSRARWLIVLLAGLLLVPAAPTGPAHAAPRDGFDLQHFLIRAGHDRVFHVEGSEVVPAWSPIIGLWLHFTDDPLRRTDSSLLGVTHTDVVDNHLYGELSAGLGFLDLFEAHLVLPVTLWADGDDSAFANLGSAGVGDLGLRLRFELLGRDPDEGGFGVGAGLEVRLPIGDATTLYSDDSVRIEPRVMLTYGIGDAMIAFDLGVLLRTNPSKFQNLDVGHELTYGVGATYRIIEILSVGAELFGRTSFATFFGDEANSPLELAAGPMFHLPHGFQIDVGMGLGMVAGYGVPDWRVFGGVQWAWWSTEPLDSDGDGLPDELDLCPFEPEDLDGFKDTDGCPEPDNDLDGILDGSDRCPLDPEDKDGWWDEDGCPDRDNDEDGILDTQDKCPDDPETRNGFEDEDGCPDEVPAPEPEPEPEPEPRVEVKRARIEIFSKVHFGFDSARIEQRSYPILREVARVMGEHPEIALVEIQGHTDERGDAGYNRSLSERRADAVAEFLVMEGIDRLRVITRGYGDSVPLQDADNEDAWAQNRRVEFHILKRAGE